MATNTAAGRWGWRSNKEQSSAWEAISKSGREGTEGPAKQASVTVKRDLKEDGTAGRNITLRARPTGTDAQVPVQGKEGSGLWTSVSVMCRHWT